MDEQVSQLESKLHRAHSSFIQVAHQLKPEQRVQPGVCGEWSPIEVVNHLIGWDESLVGFIVSPDDFEPPDDIDRFNTQSVATRSHLGWDESLDELETNFQALKQALATVKSTMKIYKSVVRWLPGRVADYELHSSQIEAWL